MARTGRSSPSRRPKAVPFRSVSPRAFGSLQTKLGTGLGVVAVHGLRRSTPSKGSHPRAWGASPRSLAGSATEGASATCALLAGTCVASPEISVGMMSTGCLPRTCSQRSGAFFGPRPHSTRYPSHELAVCVCPASASASTSSATMASKRLSCQWVRIELRWYSRSSSTAAGGKPDGTSTQPSLTNCSTHVWARRACPEQMQLCIRLRNVRMDGMTLKRLSSAKYRSARASFPASAWRETM
mmetsp:Transcript_50102/g.141218  ORF Transcript_50102/g.141218 Transcript_50102/m.141218 type:complete len:241 (+) Transcript_50102:203-925(+)